MFVIWSINRARDQKKIFKANPKINILGIQKKYSPGIPCFLGFLPQFGDKTVGSGASRP
jgi:hypothetical protein